MLDLNAVALDVCGSGHAGIEAATTMRAVVGAARRTRDLRFLDVATWFAESLEAVVSGNPEPTAGSTPRIEEIRTSGRVALEVFIPRTIGREELQVPFVLSPHWRY